MTTMLASSEAGPSIIRNKKRSRVDEAERGPRMSHKADEVGEDINVDEADQGEDSDGPAEPSLQTASAKRTTKKPKKSRATPGIVYISRLPPGMTPQKVRHLMAKWGDVGKVYAQRRDAHTGYNPNAAAQKKQRHQRADFTEAWVEFLSKSVAKTVAQMLNAQMIGGKKGDKWRDDIWTMRYLSGFKWEMLGEQIAYERESHTSRLRNEIARSKTEQGEYLRNVELARVLEKRKQKKAAAGVDVSEVKATESRRESGKNGQDEDRKHGYRQRQAVDRGKATEENGMKAVLGNIFG